MNPMLGINLVPVRELQRAGRNRAHRRVETAVTATILLVLLALTWRTWTTESELRTRLGSAFAAGNVPDAAQKLLRERRHAAREELSLVESLGRRAGLHDAVLRSVAEALPDAIWLTKLEMTRDALMLEGHARDHAVIAQFLRALESNQLLAEHQLTGAYHPKEALDRTGTRFSTRSRIAFPDREAKDGPEAPE